MARRDKNADRQRVKEIFNKLQMRGEVETLKDFANFCEFKPSSMSEIWNEKRDVPASLMQKLVKAYNVNPEFMYEGEGAMFNEKQYVVERGTKTNVSGLVKLEERGEKKMIPHYDVDATAGNEIIIFDGQAKQYIKEYIQVQAFADCELVIDVRGNSMYPKFCAGEMIALKRIKDWSVVAYGEAHVVVTAEQILLKYIDPSSEKRAWILRSENPTHHSFEVPQNKVKHLYIVKGKVVVNQM